MLGWYTAILCHEGMQGDINTAINKTTIARIYSTEKVCSGKGKNEFRNVNQRGEKGKKEKNLPTEYSYWKTEVSFLSQYKSEQLPWHEQSVVSKSSIWQSGLIKKKGCYRGNERITTTEDSETPFILLHTHLCFLNIWVCIGNQM